MKIKIITIFTLILCIFALSGCDNTYTKKEYENLSNKENYRSFEVKFSYVRFLEDNKQSSSYQNEKLQLVVTFLILEELNLFKTIKLESVSSLDSYPIMFTIFEENTNLLIQNNFFNEVNEGDIITIWVSMYRGIDTIYNYLGGLSTNNKTYLSLDEGIDGIKKHMDSNRSPFLQ